MFVHTIGVPLQARSPLQTEPGFEPTLQCLLQVSVIESGLVLQLSTLMLTVTISFSECWRSSQSICLHKADQRNHQQQTLNAQCSVPNHKSFTTELEMSEAFNDDVFSRIKEISKENPSVSLQQLIETLQDLKTRFHNLLPLTGQLSGGAV